MGTSIQANKKTLYGILSGIIVYAVVGLSGLYLLRICWTDYAIAARDKSYTVGMLLSRLLVGLLASVLAGIVATKVADEKADTAWRVGAIVFCVAAYIHFLRVWADYPEWYHFAYLLPIIPVTGISHYLFSKRK